MSRIDLPQWLPAWFHDLWELLLPWIPTLTIAGIAMAVASMIAVPLLLLKIPAEYFVSPRRPRLQRGPLGWAMWLVRNTLAAILVLAGAIMLILPGQGLLTILIGLAVSTWAGKYRLERAIIRIPSVFHSVNWLRRRYNRPPILYPDPEKTP